MAKSETVKCSYKHCDHFSRELPRSEAVKVGTRYMHESCAKTKQLIEEIRNYYYENISNTVVMKALVATINNIVFDKSVSPEYLLFVLKYAHQHGIPVRAPYSLHYLIDDARLKKEWQKHLDEKTMKEMAGKAVDEAPVASDSGEEFKFSSKAAGFNSIFGK